MNPACSFWRAFPPTGAYETQAFFTGVLEGYNTMDALAGLAFGIIVVQVVRGLGVEESGDVAKIRSKQECSVQF